MTLSNETSVTETWRKSRTFTWIAALTAFLTICAFGFLVYKVNALESEYGEIRASKERILRDIENGQEQRALILSDVDSSKQELAGLKAEVAQAQALQKLLSDLNEQVDQARQTLTGISQQTVDAEQVIALSAGAITALARAKDEQNELIRRIEQLSRNVADAENQARSFQSSRDLLQDEVRDLEAKKTARDKLRLDFDSASRELETVKNELVAAGGDLAQKQADADTAERRAGQAQDDLDRLLPRVEEAGRELNNIRSEISLNTANLEGLQRDAEILKDRVAILKTEEARLNSVDVRAEQALAQLKDAEAKLSLAKERRTQAEADLQTLRDEQDRVRALGVNLAELQNRETEAVQKIEGLNADIMGKSAARDTLLSDLSNVKAQLVATNTLLLQRQSDRMLEEATLQSQAIKLADIMRQLSRLEPQLAPLRSQVDDAIAELDKIEALASAETQELIRVRSQVANRTNELAGLLRVIAELEPEKQETTPSNEASLVEGGLDPTQPDAVRE